VLLITGASGGVGQHLLPALMADGHPLRIATRSGVALPRGVEAVRIPDLGPETDWRKALDGVSGVLHLAGLSNDRRYRVADLQRVNVAGSTKLATDAAAAGVRHLLLLSSTAVLGTGDIDATLDSPLAPRSRYARSRAEAESGVAAALAGSGCALTILRAPPVYGLPGQRDRGGNVAALVRWVERGWPVPVGRQPNQRPLLGADNLVSALRWSVGHPDCTGIRYAADADDVSTADLVRELAGLLGHAAHLVPLPRALLRALGPRADALHRSLLVPRNLGAWQPVMTRQEQLRRWLGPVGR